MRVTRLGKVTDPVAPVPGDPDPVQGTDSDADQYRDSKGVIAYQGAPPAVLPISLVAVLRPKYLKIR